MDAEKLPSLIDKALDKIPTDKIYEDLFQSGLKKAGEALSTVLDLSNTILFPIKLANERVRLIFKYNMERYETKLKDSNNEVVQVHESIGLPILDKLTYVTQKNISEAYINLLTKASFEGTVELVHPSFLMVINNISSDEAKLLFQIKDKMSIPFIEMVGITTKNGSKYKTLLASRLTGLEIFYELDFPKNIDLYLINLEKLGLIELDRTASRDFHNSEYELLEKKYYSDAIKDSEIRFNEVEEPEGAEKRTTIYKNYLQFTDYGNAFLKACIIS